MPAAPLPSNESERLVALDRYGILDTLPEQEYDDIVGIASRICKVPIALVSIVDENRQWFKARVGVDVTETDRDAAFCAHAILNPDEVLSIADATQDARFADNPLVTGNPKIRFYAGSPLVTPEGVPLGTLCVIDSKPRELTPTQNQSLQALGRQVSALLELRRRTNHLEFYRTELERSNRELNDFALVASHDLKAPIRGINHLANFLIADHGDDLPPEAIEKVDRIMGLTDRAQNLMNRLLHYAKVGSDFQGNEWIDLNEVVHHLKESLVEQIEQANAIIKSAQLPKVSGERFLVEELLQNLVSNAIKYNDSEQKIVEIGFSTIKDASNGASITAIYVADNGIGIDKSQRKDVFTIFRRLHGPQEYGGGTGAGLAIVQKIVKTHGGNIWIDDTYRDGSCFWFSFQAIDESMRKLFRIHQ